MKMAGVVWFEFERRDWGYSNLYASLSLIIAIETLTGYYYFLFSACLCIIQAFFRSWQIFSLLFISQVIHRGWLIIIQICFIWYFFFSVLLVAAKNWTVLLVFWRLKSNFVLFFFNNNVKKIKIMRHYMYIVLSFLIIYTE